MRGNWPNYQSVNNEDPYQSILEDPDVGLDLQFNYGVRKK